MNVRFGATVLLLNVALAAGCARALGPGPGPAAALRTACVIPRVVQEPHLVCSGCGALRYEVEYTNTCGQTVAVFYMLRNRYYPSRNGWGRIRIQGPVEPGETGWTVRRQWQLDWGPVVPRPLAIYCAEVDRTNACQAFNGIPLGGSPDNPAVLIDYTRVPGWRKVGS